MEYGTDGSAEPDALDLPTFLRKFEQRADGIMWLIGAGASRASGIKTAGDMIWDFKARLYRSAKGVPASAVSDLGDQRVQDLLQNYFDQDGSFPPLNSEDEYARLFEETYPDAQDRRRYIDNMVRGAKPTFGHLAMAHLIKRDLIRVVWTTNFDRLLEDAVNKVMETGSVLTVGALGEPDTVKIAISQQRWPIYAKLHGDFQSNNLKNTSDELSSQDAAMRDLFLDTCRNQGLAVSGYSGRDHSILEVLDEAINDGAGFPNGLFWFVRSQDNVYEGVKRLIAKARSNGIDACFVQAESCDELFSDIVRYLPQTEELSIKLDGRRITKPKRIDLSERKANLPFLRTNAIPITEYPQTFRLVQCDIGGGKEISDAIANKGSSLLAGRIPKGVIAFGDDGEIKRVFEDFDIQGWDTHGALADRLIFESGERRLLRDALFSAISIHSGLAVIRRGHKHLIRADKGDPNFDLSLLTRAAGRLHGVLPLGDISWAEACYLRLDYRLERLWLLLEPAVLIDTDEHTPNDALQSARNFVRERRIARYNNKSNAILDGWVRAICGKPNDTIALGVDGGTGIGARFELFSTTGFSGLENPKR